MLAATLHLKNLQQFSFEAEIMEDMVFESRQSFQANHKLSYHVKRPNKLHFKVEGDFRDREWFYDGVTISAYDFQNNFYSREKFPPTIDEALTKAEEELNLRLSIIGIARTDFNRVLTEGIQKATLVGISKVGGIPCYQVLLERERVNVQLWIQVGKNPLFRKVVVIHKAEEGSPQWSAIFSKWDTTDDFPDRLFLFIPPPHSVKIEFLKQGE